MYAIHVRQDAEFHTWNERVLDALADQKLEVRIEQCGRWRLRFVAAPCERLRASSMIARNHTPQWDIRRYRVQHFDSPLLKPRRYRGTMKI
jgi:hypothetical protein